MDAEIELKEKKLIERYGKEKLVLKINKKPLSEEDINHYAKVFGFDSDEYTKEEKYLLAVNRYCYWHYN